MQMRFRYRIIEAGLVERGYEIIHASEGGLGYVMHANEV